MSPLGFGRLKTATIPMGTAWLLGACMEARGKQDLWLRQKPEALAALRQQALIQSAESSNRIAGVTVAAKRLRHLVLGESKPRDHSEAELAGYRGALNWIHSRKGEVSMSPEVICRLHALAQGGHSSDAGEFKQRDTVILEDCPDGRGRIGFLPTAASETPKALEDLCEQYRQAVEAEAIPSLVLAASFVFDLLCVHPFRDGNGRVSRLVTTQLLTRQGFEVVRYISLERLVEERKAEYSDILRSCAPGGQDGPIEIVPWWNYFLGVLRSGYRDFEHQIQVAGVRPGKTELVRRAVLDQVGPFTLVDLSLQLPAVSPQLIQKVLAELKSGGEVLLHGRGRGATWSVRANG